MLGKTCLMGELIYDNETAVYYTPHLTLSFHHKMQTRSLRTTNLSPGWPAGRPAGPLWAKIAQNIKKTPLTVNVIDFEFFVLMYLPYFLI